MNIPDYHLEKAYVFSVGNVETEGTVTYLPIYMCYLLKEQKLGQMIVELDTTGLQIEKVIIIIDEYDVLLGYKRTVSCDWRVDLKSQRRKLCLR